MYILKLIPIQFDIITRHVFYMFWIHILINAKKACMYLFLILYMPFHSIFILFKQKQYTYPYI